MAIKNILFDLDGTLLPMELEPFMKDYMGRLAAYMAPYGYDPKALVDAIMRGTYAMVKNDGLNTNEEVFWQTAKAVLGRDVRLDEPHFEEFYHAEFDKVQATCGFDPEAREATKALKALGYRLVLATNPLFPRIATEKRAGWAGLDLSDFDLYTTYENSRHCKPNLDYYRDILATLDLDPAECLMVGNDVGEDMIAEELGMAVYLVPRCLINRKAADISRYPQGSLMGLVDFVKTL